MVFTFETAQTSKDFDSLNPAENRFYHAAASGRQAWLFLDGNTLAYTEGSVVYNRSMQVITGQSMPLWAKP